MYKVGITGGIGSGKSTVTRMLEGMGVAVYISDERAKLLMAHDETLRQLLVERFGEDTYINGELNRRYLAERVFSNADELAALNAIVHPAVMDDFSRWAEEQESPYVVIESAILFEAKLDDRVDCVVSVLAPTGLRIERAMSRDGASREEIERRIANQISDDERTERSKYAIVNILMEDLEEDVEQLHRRLVYDSKPHDHTIDQ
jgi:dephospho-CoA kinase